MSNTRKGKPSAPLVFIWDLDDTLIWTSWAYSRAFGKFYEYMLSLFDYRLIELRTLGTISEEIDKGLIKEINPNTQKPYGYSMERFPESLVRTYKWLCDKEFGRYQNLVERRARIIGMEAFDPLGYKQQGLVKGAKATLDFLKKQGDVLILLTKGERLVQECKIVTLELDQWFGENIHIVDSKTEATFREYRKEFPDSTIYSIGNSYASDMSPALAAGERGIFIPYYTWLGEEQTVSVDTTRVFQLGHIAQLIDIYPKLRKNIEPDQTT